MQRFSMMLTAGICASRLLAGCAASRAEQAADPAILAERVDRLQAQNTRQDDEIRALKSRMEILQKRLETAAAAPAPAAAQDDDLKVVKLAPRPAPTAPAPAPRESRYDNAPPIRISGASSDLLDKSGGDKEIARLSEAVKSGDLDPDEIPAKKAASAPAASTAPPPQSSKENEADLKFHLAYTRFAAGQYDDSVKLMEEFIRKYPDHHYADNAIFLIGESYFQRKQYQLAINEYQRVSTLYPKGNKVPDSLHKIARSYLALNDKVRAREVLERVMRTYPDSRAATLARDDIQSLDQKGALAP
ncbi:MAG: Outer membrane protein assembly factor BamD [Myxococcota bacterium]|nr:Outer membrane protein assembly factor BamD [Myxococcota bacterium]